MSRDNISMYTIHVYMAHVCFMSVVLTVWGVCGNDCCVAAVVKDSVLALEC